MPNAPRKVIYNVATSLDGYIAGSGGDVSAFLVQGDHVTDYVSALQSDYSAVLMGRRTYESGLAQGVTDPYPFLETYVVSQTLRESPHARVQIVGSDWAALVRGLKQRSEKHIYLCGGGELAGSLLRVGLIDELHLKVNPIWLGGGTPLVAGATMVQQFQLLGVVAYKSGVVLQRYAVPLR